MVRINQKNRAKLRRLRARTSGYRRPRRLTTVNSFASLLQACVVSLSIIIGGFWSWWNFSGLLEAQKAIAEARKEQAEADIAERLAKASTIVNVKISGHQLNFNDGGKWISVDVSLKNSGNEKITLNMSGGREQENARFYVARVKNVDKSGSIQYADPRMLKFDYADKSLNWFVLRPGAELDQYSALQKVELPGLYLARFAILIPDANIGINREYSGQTFFLVK